MSSIVCRNKKNGHVAPARSGLDLRLDKAHVAYFYYARGRCLSYAYAETTVEDVPQE